jgi:hypothetical protein
MTTLSPEQQSAVDASPEAPARVPDPSSGVACVLLKSDDFDWIRNLLKDEPDAPRLTDPRTQQGYALLLERRYERFKAFFEEDPITLDEQKVMLRAAGLRAGWNDPIWDDWDSMNAPTDREVR